MQIEGGLGGESDITHGNGPGERHFDVISLVGDSVKEREKAVYVFIIDVVVEKHDENEAEGEFFLTVQEGLEKIPEFGWVLCGNFQCDAEAVTNGPVVYPWKELCNLVKNDGKGCFCIANQEAPEHDFFEAVLGTEIQVLQPVFFSQLFGKLTEGGQSHSEYIFRAGKQGGIE